ncbi:MAG: OsmC family protein [Pseudomonas sp.]|jgi:putative redox protein|nr:OsmC family protein [Pseudomonas sp.]
MSIDVIWQSDCRFNVVTEGGFEISIDSESKSAPCPTEILLSALGSCSATDVALYFKDNGIELKGLTNSLTYELTESEPELYKSVNLHFSIESEKAIEIQVKAAIEDAINKYCHVCLMLQPKMLVTYTLDIIS